MRHFHSTQRRDHDADARTGRGAGRAAHRRTGRHGGSAVCLMFRMRTLPDALADAAQSGVGYCFVVDGVDTSRSYAEIYRSALSVGRSLREAGLGRDDVVAIVLPDAEEYLTALFG